MQCNYNVAAVRIKTVAANVQCEKGKELWSDVISLSCRLSPCWEESYQRVPSLIRAKNRV